MQRHRRNDVSRRSPATPGGRAGAAPAPPTSRGHDPRTWGVLVVLATLVCFSPAMTAEFSNWDDPQTIAQNPRLNPPTLANVLSFWDPRKPYMDLYVPVTYTAWSALAAVAYVPQPDEAGVRLNPWVFHAANVAIHAASALAAFAVLRRLVQSAPAAAAGALLFALHPVQVEPVGWTSGTKDLLWGMLGLVAVWQYLVFAQAGRRGEDEAAGGEAGADTRGETRGDARGVARGATSGAVMGDPGHSRPGVHYAVATGAFVLAMLAKPTAVVLPAIVLVLDVLVLRRPVRKALLAVLPWVLLAVPVAVEAKYAQPVNPEQTVATRVPPALRPMIAADALAFYLYKLAVPVHLGPLYDRAPTTVLQHKWHLWTWVAPAAAGAVALLLLRRAPWVAAALAVFGLGVAPVSGLVPFDFQSFSTVSDHYLYLSMLGPAMALAFALELMWRRAAARESPRAGRALAAGVAVLLAVLGVRSFLQAFHWQDSVALFRHAARVNPRSAVAYTHLATALEDRQRFGEAAAAYEAAVRVRPDLPELRTNLAGFLARTGDYARAEALYREVLAQRPDFKLAGMGLAELERIRLRPTPPAPGAGGARSAPPPRPHGG